MTSSEPGPHAAADARAWIEQLLRDRDIAAFAAGDWDAIAGEFDAEEFVGLVEQPNTARTVVAFPDLAAYRSQWLQDSAAVLTRVSEGQLRTELLTATSMAVDVAGRHAVARKVIDGVAGLARYDRVVEYRLRRVADRWRVTGFTCRLGGRDSFAGSSPAGDGPNAGRHRVPAGAAPHSGSGPYSPVLVVASGLLVAISGQGPLNAHGEVVGDTIEEQTAATFENCRRQLAAAGCTLRDVWKVTVYLADLGDWHRMNAVYADYFAPPSPVRATVGASLLMGMKIEIEMLATRPADRS